MDSLVLMLNSLTVWIGERLILSGVDLALERGKCLVLMGPGGGGKSTLMRTICGVDRESHLIQVGGQAHYLGASILRDAVAARPAFVEQKLSMMSATAFELLSSRYPERERYTREDLRRRLRHELDALGEGALARHFDTELLALSPCERRLLTLVAAVLPDPELLCADEPMARLSEEDSQRILRFLTTQKQKRSLFLTTHNQRYARQIADYTAILAEGTIHECTLTESFFRAPYTRVAQEFIRSGSCTVDSPQADPRQLSPAYLARQSPWASKGTPALQERQTRAAARPAPGNVPSESRGPYGFHWMRPGRLAGTPMPGIVRPIEEDLGSLKRMNITALVSLTEIPLDSETLKPYAIDLIHFPIVDMHPPQLQAAGAFCARIQRRLAQGDVIAFHCRAGIGRTGTMLAAFEVFEGLGAEDAFSRARQIHPRWIQSELQHQFLNKFERWLESAVARDGSIQRKSSALHT